MTDTPFSRFPKSNCHLFQKCRVPSRGRKPKKPVQSSRSPQLPGTWQASSENQFSNLSGRSRELGRIRKSSLVKVSQDINKIRKDLTRALLAFLAFSAFLAFRGKQKKTKENIRKTKENKIKLWENNRKQKIKHRKQQKTSENKKTSNRKRKVFFFVKIFESDTVVPPSRGQALCTKTTRRRRHSSSNKNCKKKALKTNKPHTGATSLQQRKKKGPFSLQTLARVHPPTAPSGSGQWRKVAQVTLKLSPQPSRLAAQRRQRGATLALSVGGRGSPFS